MRPGAYAYIPAGYMGASLRTRSGAELLYFVNDADEREVIQTRLITGVDAATWQPVSDDPLDLGVSELELRADPGSGARTWLLKVEPGAMQGWQSHSAEVEGYLLSGDYQHSECVNGEAVTGSYRAGGYFLRPAGAVNGGPEAESRVTSVWLLRRLGPGERQLVEGCEGPG